MANLFDAVGAKILDGAEGAGYTLLLLARTAARSRTVLTRFRSVLKQMSLAGVESWMVVAVVAFTSGMIVALQTGIALRDYSFNYRIGSIVAPFMVREWAPVMSALILAGRVGSAMAAEIGTMKVSEEIDALDVMSVDTVSYLVTPRVFAMAVMGPILTVYANVIGIIGGALVGRYHLMVSYPTYFKYAQDSLDGRDIAGGLLKAFVFGITVAIVSCSQGLRAENGAEGVGEVTRRSVVLSFLLVLIFDYFLGWAIYAA